MVYYWKEDKKEEKKIPFPLTESVLTDVKLTIDKESGDDE